MSVRSLVGPRIVRTRCPQPPVVNKRDACAMCLPSRPNPVVAAGAADAGGDAAGGTTVEGGGSGSGA